MYLKYQKFKKIFKIEIYLDVKSNVGTFKIQL